MVIEQIKKLITAHLAKTPEGKIPLIVILGPTAVGKTALSIKLAKEYKGEVISADSRQVYKSMDIGTDKISMSERSLVPHHMLDVVNPDEEFSVYDFKVACEQLISEICARGHVPFLVGGTMLYIDAVTKNFDFGGVPPDENLRNKLQEFLKEKGKEALREKLRKLDPETAEKIHQNNTHYVLRAIEKATSRAKAEGKAASQCSQHVLKIGLIRQRKEIYDRINLRVDAQMKDGKLEAEAKVMIEKYGTEEHSLTGLGHRTFIPYFNHEIKADGKEYNLDDVKNRLQKDTRNFAKRQLSWWRKDDQIHWFDVSDS